MASAEACQSALTRLGQALDGVDPELRQKHVPRRTVGCSVTDLDIAFTGVVGPEGFSDLTLCHITEIPACDVRVACSSDDLIALADGDDSIVNAWLHGRVHISASVRDILRLRSLVGL